jgi:hypothetical protein
MDELLSKLVALLESEQARNAGITEVSDPDEDHEIVFSYNTDQYVIGVAEF